VPAPYGAGFAVPARPTLYFICYSNGVGTGLRVTGHPVNGFDLMMPDQRSVELTVNNRHSSHKL